MDIATRDRILEEALKMFVQRGYEGTNLRDLARNLGLSKSALYKHYESKADIWNSLVERMERRYILGRDSAAALDSVPRNAEELLALTLRMTDFTMHDGRIVLMRKLLASEQYRDEMVRDIASEHFLYMPERMFTGIFTEMMRMGLMRTGDPDTAAFAYTTPIGALIHERDRKPDKEPELRQKLIGFVRSFAEVWGIGQPPEEK